MKRFVLTDAAEKDLDDIWFYILPQAIVTLADNPGIGRPCSEEIDPSGRWFL